MPILPFQNNDHIIYENISEGMLVAITEENNKKIKEFFKKNKGKKKLPSTKIKGFWFVIDKEYDSLKIDFSNELDFQIKDLKLFPLK